jgi:hypothetical protein
MAPVLSGTKPTMITDWYEAGSLNFIDTLAAAYHGVPTLQDARSAGQEAEAAWHRGFHNAFIDCKHYD